jgi:hypothetical protein
LRETLYTTCISYWACRENTTTGAVYVVHVNNANTIVINSIEVLGQEDFNIINIIIKYRIVNTGINDELQINFA